MRRRSRPYRLLHSTYTSIAVVFPLAPLETLDLSRSTLMFRVNSTRAVRLRALLILQRRILNIYGYYADLHCFSPHWRETSNEETSRRLRNASIDGGETYSGGELIWQWQHLISIFIAATKHAATMQNGSIEMLSTIRSDFSRRGLEMASRLIALLWSCTLIFIFHNP